MGYIYNERTGEFKTKLQMAWSMLLLPFKWLLAPFLLFGSLFRMAVAPFAFLKRLFPRLAVLLTFPVVLVWRIVRNVVRWVFYPAIKWWDIAKNAIDGRDWFLLVLWCVPGYLLVLIYWAVLSPFLRATVEIAWLILQLLWELAYMAAQRLRSVTA